MKTCPQCGSLAFDDQDTCYGCMHRFFRKPPASVFDVADTPSEQHAGPVGRALAGVVLVERGADGRETCHLVSPGTQLVIGRSLRCDVVLAAPDVSRVHARVGLDEAGAWLEDCGSSNRTYLAASPVSGRTPLSEGSEFSICGTTFHVHVLASGGQRESRGARRA